MGTTGEKPSGRGCPTGKVTPPKKRGPADIRAMTPVVDLSMHESKEMGSPAMGDRTPTGNPATWGRRERTTGGLLHPKNRTEPTPFATL
jgi:hypothetical protein